MGDKKLKWKRAGSNAVDLLDDRGEPYATVFRASSTRGWWCDILVPFKTQREARAWAEKALEVKP